MEYNGKFKKLLGGCAVFLYINSSCIAPICSSRHTVWFKNITPDTLFVVMSCFNSIDSVSLALKPTNKMYNNSVCYNEDSLINGWKFQLDEFICPDSMCYTSEESMFLYDDTCYFFLVKFDEMKRYSWKEICSKKLYHKMSVVRDKEGNFDRNIRYERE